MMRAKALLGFCTVVFFAAACGDNGTGGEQGGGGSGGSSSQGGGGSGPCANVADGSQAKEQVQGDCKKKICQGGMVTDLNDDSDTPDDGNDCTHDGCSAGMPTATPERQGTACSQNGGDTCDAGGACVKTGCADKIKDNDETDVDCGGGTCMPCDDMKGCAGPADCKSGVCTGSVCQAPTCDDMVKNGEESDADCGGPTCPKCALGEQCGGDVANCDSGHCSNGVCCNVDCGGTCIACNVAGMAGTCALVPTGEDPNDECTGNGGNDVCSGDGSCVAMVGGSCMAGENCLNGHCVDGICCSTPCAGQCKGCAMATTGQPDGTCADVTMGTDPHDDCAGSLVCMPGGCSMPLPLTSPCTVGGECESGFCSDGICCNTSCTGPCRSCKASIAGQGTDGMCTPMAVGTDPEDECAGPLNCNGSTACFKALGAACAGGGECASGFCADGVCCNTACPGVCKQCNAAATAGTCTNIPANTDPFNECAGAANCNGMGACN